MSAPLPPSTALALSIDLGAELKSLTERQHLNDVHYAVQLVRHALEHHPSEVHVRVGRRAFEIEHDGEPLSREEAHLLLEVTRGAPSDARQAALSELDRRFGVVLLSLLLHATRVTIESEISLTASGGRVSRAPGERARGYRIVVERPARRARRERAELRFYCKHARVPLLLDGKPINAPLGLEHVLLAGRLDARPGTLQAGLPKTSALSRVRYYKHGIYFGLRQSLPRDGRPVEALFDSALPGPEDNFRDSVKVASRLLRRGVDYVYEQIPSSFTALRPAHKARVRALLLGMPAERWTPELAALPLFDTSRARFSVSLDQLREDASVRGFLPFTPKPSAWHDDVLMLAPEDRARMEALVGSPLRRALSFHPRPLVATAKRWFARGTPRPPRATPVRLPLDAVPDEVGGLIARLNESGGTRFSLVIGGGRRRVTTDAGDEVLIPVDDPLLKRAARGAASRPEILDAVRLALSTPRP